MLCEYIEKAMSKALYDKLEDGSFAGRIPPNALVLLSLEKPFTTARRC